MNNDRARTRVTTAAIPKRCQSMPPMPRRRLSRWSALNLIMHVPGHSLDCEEISPIHFGMTPVTIPAFEHRHATDIVDAWNKLNGHSGGYSEESDTFWFISPSCGPLEFQGVDVGLFHVYPICLPMFSWMEDEL